MPVRQPAYSKTLNQLAGRTFPRLADWLDSIIHLEMHAMSHYVPECFDPDPEKRELATLGVRKQFQSDASEYSKAHFEWHLSELAQLLKNSPKWKAFDRAAVAPTEGIWPFEEADTLIISIWPLLAKHNWATSQLFELVRAHASRPSAYPFNNLRDFAEHCSNSLGLSNTLQIGPMPADFSKLPGYAVAKRLLTSQAQQKPPLHIHRQ
jgi:hypothetical protein